MFALKIKKFKYKLSTNTFIFANLPNDLRFKLFILHLPLRHIKCRTIKTIAAILFRKKRLDQNLNIRLKALGYFIKPIEPASPMRTD
ncbi:hypothetical protein CJU45_26595 [Pseudomonas aeruginosa]|nr:hypothetical protein CJU44_26825 [Pseudomonas aeruginosa]PCA15735.1 hypothetical protein CJU45_26595 [Pseudomonas aeruginosa]PCA22295.1 hypothetical protein CJU43_26690 [Pseudomonas aeruginosa]PCA27958.1 hypothetical protein CJU42_26825 [Pseudomonas aeruginosa]